MSALTTTSPPRAARLRDHLDAIILVVLIVAMCSQLNLGTLGRDTLKEEGYATKQLFLALSDLVLAGAAAWFILQTTVMRAWRRVWLPPLPCWALIAAMLLAAIHSQGLVDVLAPAVADAHGLGMVKALIKAIIHNKESKEALAKILQFFEYFVLAPLVFVNLMHDVRGAERIERRRLALLTFSLATLAATIVAAVQLLQMPATPPLYKGVVQPPHVIAPRGFFESPNVYAGFLAIALPLLLVRLMHRWRGQSTLVALVAVTLVAGIFTMSSPWAVVAIAAGILAGGFAIRLPYRMTVLLGATCLLTYAAWSVPTHLDANRALYTPWYTPAGAEPGEKPRIRKQFVEWFVALGWNSPQPVPAANPEIPERLRAFGTGVGPGNYQLNIGPYYQFGSLGELAKEKMPPDSNNLYLVQGVSLGLLGLGALLWVLGYFWNQARVAQWRFPADWLGAGVLASLTAFFVVNLNHALIVRGAGIVVAFLCSLAIVAVQRMATIDEV